MGDRRRTGRAGVDYTSAVGTLVFTPGELVQSIAVTVLGNTLVQASRSFVVRLLGVAGAVVARDSASATILDDDHLQLLPPAVTSEATSATGATVAYGAAAVPNATTPVSFAYSHLSGSVFALGTTTVTVTATTASRTPRPRVHRDGA